MSITATTAASQAAEAPRYITPEEQLAHDAAVAARCRANEMRAVHRERAKTFALILAAPLIASGWIMWAKHPRIQQEVEFIPITESGVPVSTHRWQSLPAATRDLAVSNTLWNYLRYREGYSHAEAEYGWRVVVALSTEDMAKDYAAANDPRNPNSPWQRYGEKVRIEVRYHDHQGLCSVQVCADQPDIYKFWFWRTEVRDGVRGEAVLHSATVRFRRDVDAVDPQQRAAINAPALKVWEYVPGSPVPVGTPQGGVRR